MPNLAISKKKRTTRKFLSKRKNRKFLSKKKTYRKKKYLKGGYTNGQQVNRIESDHEIEEENQALNKYLNEDKNITKGFFWGNYMPDTE